MEYIAAQIAKLPVITPEQELVFTAKLREMALAGQVGSPEWLKVRNEFCELNYRLVMKAVGRFTHRGADREELFQEGVVGMMRACETFEPERGLRFGTYAWLWITHFMRRFCDEKIRDVRVPHHTLDELKKVMGVLAKNPDFNDEAIAAATGFTIERVRELKLDNPKLKSIFDHVSEDTEYGDLLEGASVDPVEVLEQKENIAKAETLLSFIDERARSIVESRFGLNDKDEMTLQELGDASPKKVTRERIRQVEKEAMVTMRRRYHNQQLARSTNRGVAQA